MGSNYPKQTKFGVPDSKHNVGRVTPWNQCSLHSTSGTQWGDVDESHHYPFRGVNRSPDWFAREERNIHHLEISEGSFGLGRHNVLVCICEEFYCIIKINRTTILWNLYVLFIIYELISVCHGLSISLYNIYIYVGLSIPLFLGLPRLVMLKLTLFQRRRADFNDTLEKLMNQLIFGVSKSIHYELAAPKS